MKLKHTIFILLFSFTLIPMYVFGLFMMYENDRKIEKLVVENLEAVGGTQILDIRNFCDARRESLEMIAGYRIIQDAIRESLDGTQNMTSDQKKYLENILSERRSYNDFVESISIINKDFLIVASSEECNPGGVSDLKNVKKEKISSDFFISNLVRRGRGDQMIDVLIACQRVEEDGEVIGYIVEEILPTYFDKNRTETNFLNGTLYLLDGNERVITAGTAVGESRREYVTSPEERQDYNRAWSQVDLEKNPSGSIRYRINGIEYITYYAPIQYTDWDIKVTISLSDYQSSRQAYRLLLGISLVIVSLIMLITNYFITKRLTRPAENIVEVLKNVQKEQDYSLRIRDDGKGEMGMLSSKINELLDYIEKENLLERERQRYLKSKAERDPLTGLKNKKALEEQLQVMLLHSAENGRKAAVGFLDVDNFRDYNTKYGHQEGDAVLRFVASVLEDHVKGIVGRNGGDEFVFGIGDVKDLGLLEKTIRELLYRLNLGMYNRKKGCVIPVPCSIGVAVGEGDVLFYSSMIRYADEAMYRAKERGKDTYELIHLEDWAKNLREDEITTANSPQEPG